MISDRLVDGLYTKRYPKPELEKESIRKTIILIKPDILILQEMGSEKFLKELQADLQTEGIDYPFSTLMQGADPIRHIAVLSKEPIKRVIFYDQLTYLFSKNQKIPVRRGLLELSFISEGFDWSLFAVHLKSRRSNKIQDESSNKQRLGEATVIGQKINERYPDPQKGLYLIMGDFNDLPKSKTLKAFLKFKNHPMAIMLSPVDSRGEVWTYYSEGYGNYSQIDYILMSPAFFNKTKVKGASIVDAPFTSKGSDHRMIYVDLDFNDSKDSCR